MGNDVYIRQCIVRIRSLQSLDKGDGGPPQQANLTEYLVMQQMNADGKAARWKIWGTTEPASRGEMEKLVEGRGGENRITLMDRLDASDPTRDLKLGG